MPTMNDYEGPSVIAASRELILVAHNLNYVPHLGV